MLLREVLPSIFCEKTRCIAVGSLRFAVAGMFFRPGRHLRNRRYFDF